jgi:hypothetical protein
MEPVPVLTETSKKLSKINVEVFKGKCKSVELQNTTIIFWLKYCSEFT